MTYLAPFILFAFMGTGAFASIVHLPASKSTDGAIHAAADTWSAMPFSDTSGGDAGTMAGFTFYPSSSVNRDKLLIYLSGGGVCEDYNGCFNMRVDGPAPGFSPNVAGLAGHFNVDPAVFSLTRNDNAAHGNFFANWSKVFVWYCTGDLHMGSHIATYRSKTGQTGTIRHFGYSNMHKFLTRLTATFCNIPGCTMPKPTKIAVAGSSAGGFGAVWNTEQIRDAFGLFGPDVVLIDDAGPFMREPYWTSALETKMAAAYWGTGSAAIPLACAGNCDPRTGGEFHDVLSSVHTYLPYLRGAMIIGEADSSISGAFSKQTFAAPYNASPWAKGPCGTLAEGDCYPDGYPGLAVASVLKLHGYFCDRAIPDYVSNEPDNFKSFVVTTTQATGLNAGYHQLMLRTQPDQIFAADGTSLAQLLATQMDGPGWADHYIENCSAWSF